MAATEKNDVMNLITPMLLRFFMTMYQTESTSILIITERMQVIDISKHSIVYSMEKNYSWIFEKVWVIAMNKIKVIIADESRIIREWLCGVINKLILLFGVKIC